MCKLNETEQLEAVKKVLEEMQQAEDIINNWNASWLEQLLDAYSLPLHCEIGEYDVREAEKKYAPRYKLANAIYSEESIGVPLTIEILKVNDSLSAKRDIPITCEFGRINWYGMYSHKAERKFSFYNNGNIEFSKDVTKKLTKQHPKKISYKTMFNVLSSNFSVDITESQLISQTKRTCKDDTFTLSMQDNLIFIKFNDIQIIRDLNSSGKMIRIEKKYDKYAHNSNSSIQFEVVLNSDDSLEKGNVEVLTHKGNGKVNGTFRFGFNRQKGVYGKFYSRKGVKIDLINAPKLLAIANNLLLPSGETTNSSQLIISDFALLTQKKIANNLSKKVISFDNYDFDIAVINIAEKRVIEMVKCIRGELPLPGLIERIESCLNLIDTYANSQTDNINGNKKLVLE